MHRQNNPSIGSLILLVLTAILGTAALLTKDADFHQPKQLKARVGNESAGSDIYGIGVRVGFYLQGIAFTINAFTSENRKGMLLAAASVQAAILASLSVLLSRNDVSPAEVLIILDVITFTTLPAILAMLSLDSGGQGLGVLLFMVDAVWTNSLNTWFWAKGYRTLPLLGTSNAGFIYTRVQIDGWFRIFNLIISSVGWITYIGIIVLGGFLLRRSFRFFGNEDEDFKQSSLVEHILPFVPGAAIALLVFTIPLLVVATEKMIQWNGLMPNTDLSAPGQVIPFAVGVVGFCDACLGILRHLFTKGDRVRGGMNRQSSTRRSVAYE